MPLNTKKTYTKLNLDTELRLRHRICNIGNVFRTNTTTIKIILWLFYLRVCRQHRRKQIAEPKTLRLLGVTTFIHCYLLITSTKEREWNWNWCCDCHHIAVSMRGFFPWIAAVKSLMLHCRPQFTISVWWASNDCDDCLQTCQSEEFWYDCMILSLRFQNKLFQEENGWNGQYRSLYDWGKGNV